MPLAYRTVAQSREAAEACLDLGPPVVISSLVPLRQDALHTSVALSCLAQFGPQRLLHLIKRISTALHYVVDIYTRTSSAITFQNICFTKTWILSLVPADIPSLGM